MECDEQLGSPVSEISQEVEPMLCSFHKIRVSAPFVAISEIDEPLERSKMKIGLSTIGYTTVGVSRTWSGTRPSYSSIASSYLFSRSLRSLLHRFESSSKFRELFSPLEINPFGIDERELIKVGGK